jgi:NitT/TauT family transport system ATP-binding protein
VGCAATQYDEAIAPVRVARAEVVMHTALQTEKIRIENLSKVFPGRQGRVEALRGVSLSIPNGQFCCIVGPSGCGKTTLLRILAGLEEPSSGTLVLNHEDDRKPLSSMVFQEQSVFPWMTVEQNIGYGLRMRRIAKRTQREVVDYYLQKTGLTRFAKAFPHQLSGGMKQRVSVARAFANDPEVLLMDEPFAALDEQNKILLQEELLKIWEDSRKTVVFITHSIDEAVVLSDSVVVMTAHPGRIKAVLPVELPRPRQVYELKADPKFGQLVYEVWSLLRDEVLRAREEEGVATR